MDWDSRDRFDADAAGTSAPEAGSEEGEELLPVPGTRRGFSRPLPTSISSLRAFEAVARRQSFTKAATELNLTQTAVSHQVRKLEARLRAQLFIRDRDGVRLTPTGREYLPAVRNALDVLASATERILERNDEASLSIVCLAAFGLKCLLPLLPDFRRRHPEIRIRFDTVISYDTAAAYNYDVAVRYGAGDWAGMVMHKIAAEELMPVCSPSFLAEARLRSPRDIVRHTLIGTRSQAFRDDWPEWLARYGLNDDDVQDWINCDTMLAASQAAIDGLGLAIGRTPLINQDLRTGRLVEPFADRLPSSTGYYVTSSAEHAQRRPVRLFTEWLRGQFEEAAA